MRFHWGTSNALTGSPGSLSAAGEPLRRGEGERAAGGSQSCGMGLKLSLRGCRPTTPPALASLPRRADAAVRLSMLATRWRDMVRWGGRESSGTWGVMRWRVDVVR